MTLQLRHEPPASVDGAARLLNTLRVGDPVLVSTDTSPDRVLAMRVSVAAMRADVSFGSHESTRVTVSLSVGRWSTEIAADRMVERTGLPRRFRIELDTWQAVLDQLADASNVDELEVARRHATSPNRSRGIWSAEHDALAALRFQQLTAAPELPPQPASTAPFAVPAEPISAQISRTIRTKAGLL